jgi:hypothetical protein
VGQTCCCNTADIPKAEYGYSGIYTRFLRFHVQTLSMTQLPISALCLDPYYVVLEGAPTNHLAPRQCGVCTGHNERTDLHAYETADQRSDTGHTGA